MTVSGIWGSYFGVPLKGSCYFGSIVGAPCFWKLPQSLPQPAGPQEVSRRHPLSLSLVSLFWSGISGIVPVYADYAEKDAIPDHIKETTE